MLGVAMKDFSRNNCSYIAAGIAYWTLFSLFPLAMAAISILGFAYAAPEDQGRIVEGIVNVVPVSVDYLARLVEDVTQARGALGGLAFVGLLWTGTAVFSAVRKGVNHAWHIGRPHYFLKERAIDLAMLGGIAALAFVQVVFSTNLVGLSELARSATESSAWALLRVPYEFLALAFTVGVFMLLYRYIPNTDVAWRDIWPGALVGAALFQAVRVLFVWFISSFGNLNVVYGSLGALMTLLLWAYLSAMAVMLGAQVAYTYRGVFGSQTGTISLPVPREGSRRGLAGVALTVVGWLLPPKRHGDEAG
jgi:membrane protein